MKYPTIKRSIVSLITGGVLLAVPVLRADVIFTTGVNLPVLPFYGYYNGEFGPNFDAPSFLGLTFQQNTYQYGSASGWVEAVAKNSDLYISAANGNSVDFLQGWNSDSGVSYQKLTMDAIKYAAGTKIGPDAYSYGWGALSVSVTEHSWIDGDRGYAGIAKKTWNDATEQMTYQYGWVDIGRSYNEDVQQSVFTVYGWAWDTTPNETINAGAFVGNGDGISVGAVPEPSSLAMLLIGVTGIASYAASKHFKRS